MRILLGVVVLVLGLGLVAWWRLLPDAPGFYLSDGAHSYFCYTAPSDQSVQIIFHDAGRSADVSFAGRHAHMRFVETRSSGEYYEGDHASMSLDPEVYVEGLSPDRIGPCE